MIVGLDKRQCKKDDKDDEPLSSLKINDSKNSAEVESGGQSARSAMNSSHMVDEKLNQAMNFEFST